jgi:hypothetical protein
MVLVKAEEIGWKDVSNVTLVYLSGCYKISFNQLAKPCGGERVNLVVVRSCCQWNPLGHKYDPLAAGRLTVCKYAFWLLLTIYGLLLVNRTFPAVRLEW